MLIVKTRLGPDAYGGIGLFADEPIPQGQVVWMIDAKGLVDLKWPLTGLSANRQALADKYGYPSLVFRNGRWEADGIMMSVDNDRHTNHSNNPNTVEREDGCMVAAWDIAAGEEITCDYRMFRVWGWPFERLYGGFIKD